MEYLFSYLRRNVVLAFKSIKYHILQYLCFFLAIFTIQTFFGIITMASDNNNDIEVNMIKEEYNYHIVLKDLNVDQYIYFLNDKQTVFKKDHIHDIVGEYVRTLPGTNEEAYDLYVQFLGDVNLSFQIFQQRYYQEAATLSPAGLRVGKTPLMSYETNLLANSVKYIVFAVLLMAVSVFLLMVLYYIRINHYKFTYGVYLTFGADFKKLMENSFWEMMLIVLATFLPASGLSYLINLLIYKSDGQIFNFYASSIVKILIFSLVIACVAVIWPTWRLSRKTPMTLIVAEDNSNLVVSPRRSLDMLGMEFPKKYELFSILRFRKYNVQLLFTSVVFTVLFMCAIFYTNMYKDSLYYEQPQFTINFNDSQDNVSYAESTRSELYEINGIKDISKNLSVAAPFISSHVSFDKKNAAPFSNFVISEEKDDTKLTSFVIYNAADEEIIKFLERYEYTGDLSKILTDKNMIIVSDSFDNTVKFKFKPGDKINIAKYLSRQMSVQSYSQGNELLKAQLKYFRFEYTEYTICAVLHDNPTFEYMPIFMNEETYTYLTDEPVEFKTAGIYIDQTYGFEQVDQIENDLRAWADYYPGVTVTNHHTLSLHNIEESKNTYVSYVIIAYLIVIFSPLMWFFTQILFYQKRSNEFGILQAFGATRNNIKKIFVFDSLFNAVSGIIICILFNYGGIYAIYKFVNVILPKFSGTAMRYDFYMPIIPFLIGILLTAACGFLSSYLPYLNYNKAETKKDDKKYTENVIFEE